MQITKLVIKIFVQKSNPELIVWEDNGVSGANLGSARVIELYNLFVSKKYTFYWQ
jgi:hypothetical protein